MKPIGRASLVAVAALVAFLIPTAAAASFERPVGTAGLRIDWHQARSTGLGGPAEIRGSAYANGAYIVFGWKNDEDGTPTIWRSTDALNWKSVWSGDGLGPSSIVAGGPGFVGWSWSGILISTNGRRWTTVTDGVPEGLLHPDWYQTLGSVGGAVVAFSGSGAGSGYWTVDGRTWEEIQNGPDGARALAGDGTHLWAFSGGRDWDEKTGRPVEVWVTEDGRSWEKVAVLPGSSRVAYPTAAFGPRGGVVVAESKAWFSTDTTHWQRAVNTPTLTRKGVDEVDAIVADTSGYIVTAHRDPGGCAIDERYRRALTWTSVDGRIWREMSEKGWLGREIPQLFIQGRTLIGVGIDWTHQEGSTGAVWRATLPDIAQDEAPPPDPIAEPAPGGCGP